MDRRLRGNGVGEGRGRSRVQRLLGIGPLATLCLAFTLAACSAGRSAPEASGAEPLTRAEATDYRETSRYADVVAFLDAVAAMDPAIHIGTFGTSVEGRDLPLAAWGARGATPEAVRAEAGKTRVLVFANIHAGEVAGKEAALMLLRDLASGANAQWKDSLVVMIAPIYNADGNERIAPGNRGPQMGPVGGMGQRPNAQGLDLNRDFMKLASPEARALVGLLRDADPHIVVDLHTTNGTHMGYHLTYAPPLSPNTPAPIDRHLREGWFPAISAEILRTDDMATDHYGNVPGAFGEPATAPRGWYTFSPQPRFGTNYGGLRNRYAILSEAYSYATFRDRVHVTKRFVEEILHRAHAEATRVRAQTEAADRQTLVGDSLAVRGGFTAPESTREMLLGAVDSLTHPVTGAPMLRMREGVRTPEAMPVFSRFEATERERVPAGYLVPERFEAVLDLLAAHGVRTESPPEDAAVEEVEQFFADSVRVAAREFQGIRQRELFGAWRPVVQPAPGSEGRPPPPGPPVQFDWDSYVYVPMDQPLARVAFALLEPRSDDGVVNWNLIRVEYPQPTPVYFILRLAAR